jgi:hypothetical protein
MRVSCEFATISVIPNTTPRDFDRFNAAPASQSPAIFIHIQIFRVHASLRQACRRNSADRDGAGGGQRRAGVARAAACGAAVVVVKNAQRVVTEKVLLFASRRCVLMRVT